MTSTSDPGRCPTVLLADEPADADAFGAHQTIAAAIAEMVQQEAGGRAIGVGGRWGSGKSTVIGLLRERLRANPNARLLVFDAWSHEGDPLRRTFVEFLVDALSRTQWLVRDDWQKLIAQLARRRRDTELEITPQFRPFGVALTIAALLVPFGAIMLASGIPKDKGFFDGFTSRGLTNTVGTILVLSPLLVSMLAHPLALGRWQFRRLRGQREDRPTFSASVAPIASHAQMNTTTTTLETPEPTSLEFSAAFKAVVAAALGDPVRRLVLVLDNLDRISPSDALRLWSTMRAFLQHEMGAPEWSERLWVVMPFDQESLKALWRDSGSTERDRASAFLDKTFQVRFEVPPPVLSDWHSYLASRLQAALPRHSASEFHAVCSVVAADFEMHNRTPTPRDLTLIVNQIGAMHRQWQDTIPLSHLAYFVALKWRDEDIVRLLRSGPEFPPPRIAGSLGTTIKDDLANLAFGVPSEKAQQLLLETPIRNALDEGDGAALARLARASSGFVTVLELVVRNASAESPGKGGTYALHAALALDNSGVLDALDTSSKSYLLELLRGWTCRVQTLSPASSKLVDGARSVARLTQDQAAITAVTKAYAATDYPLQGDPMLAAQARVDEALRLEQTLIQEGLTIPPSCWITVPGGIGGFVHAVNNTALATSKLTRLNFKPGDSVESVSTHFFAVVDGGQFRGPERQALRVLTNAGFLLNPEAIADRLGMRLHGGADGTSGEREALLESLFDLNGHASGPINSFVKEGWVAFYVAQQASPSTELAEWRATCLHAYLRVMPDLTPQAIPNDVAANGYVEQVLYIQG